MEYSINKVSRISGVSTRTLRYYDEIGLLKPFKIAESGYRIYSSAEIDTLQQILIYKELGFSLEKIKQILLDPSFDKQQAYLAQLKQLHEERDRLDLLINNVLRSLDSMKGNNKMTDNEKFEGIKQGIIDENEQKYGKEVRSRYGDEAIDESNSYLKGLSKEQFEKGELLREEIEQILASAFTEGNPAGELAQRACDLHRQWLQLYYPKYSKEYHVALSEMYVADERFRSNYDKIAAGCTEFFRDAIHIYCQD